MSHKYTVSKEIADRIIAGEFNEDNCTLIVEYDNAWGGKGYGCMFNNAPNGYTPSEFVRKPKVYWKKP